jgi:hypothetical protein
MIISRLDLKRAIIALQAEVRRVRAYAFDYGNATGECSSGYLQQSGLICHKCGADNYRLGCPLAKASESPADEREGRGSEAKPNA